MRGMTERLSVNINDECVEALRRIKAKREITTTEVIRRAISLLDHVEKAEATAQLHVEGSQVCETCGNYTDTPGHFWGCSNNPTAGLWGKRNTSSGVFDRLKRRGNPLKGVRREN